MKKESRYCLINLSTTGRHSAPILSNNKDFSMYNERDLLSVDLFLLFLTTDLNILNLNIFVSNMLRAKATIFF